MKRLYKMLLIGASMAVPMTALAAIDNTHHDMPNYTANATDQKCAYCHAVTITDIADNGQGAVGSFCIVVCHDGSTVTIGAPGYIDSADLDTVAGADGVSVVGASHGFTNTDIPLPDVGGDVDATNWPHANEGTMQCTTCHAVHDGANPPFLNAPLATGDNATAFCQRCHQGDDASANAGRWQTIGTHGAHPVEFTVEAAGTAAANATPPSPRAGGRALAFKAPLVVTDTGFSTQPTDIAAFNIGNSTATNGDGWQLGGHFIGANGLPATAAAGATMGCYSCHSAHQNEASTASGIGNGELLLGSRNAGLNDTPRNTSVICISCHGAGAVAPNTAVIWNPGTTTAGHPANEQAVLPYEHNHATHGNVHPNVPATGSFPLDVIDDLQGTLAGLTGAHLGDPGTTAGQNAILCVTCHDVHDGVDGLMAIRNLTGALTSSDRICNACHGTAAGSTDTANGNWHHPVPASTDIDGNFATAALAWDDTSGNYNMGDGLSCADCHVFGNTAHNW